METPKKINRFSESLEGFDGKWSGQKMTAFGFVVLIASIIHTFEICLIVVLVNKPTYKSSTLQLIDMLVGALTTTIFISLVAAVLGLWGVSGWTKVGIKKAEQPAPKPPANINVNQQGDKQTTNISPETTEP